MPESLPNFKLKNKGGITGYADAIKLKHEKADVKKLAGSLKSIGHFDGSVANQEGSKKSEKTARLDRQTNTSEKAANLQIQVNGESKPSTIGQVLISQAAFKAANEHKQKQQASDKLLAKFEEAMLKSYGDGNSYEIVVG